MKKVFSLFLLSIALTSGLFAQQGQIDWNSPVPVDKNVKVGKLDNGLTYYIRRNTEPKQRAEFFIAQNVGAILEEDSQNGLAHFLEHMAFNGTKNLPGKMLLNYFESVGVKFGQNINAYTSLDQTVYNLSDVPTTREGIIDTALLVLHDWSGFISLLGPEIDNERGVIREEWRTRRSPEMRMQQVTSPIVYKGSKYAKRDVIGDIDVINNFEHQTLRDYYNKWYRPDQQAIVIVGDIDVDKIEQKVKTLFADIAKRENPAERTYFEVPDNDEPLIAIASDPEARNTLVFLRYKKKITPKESKNLGYLRESMKEALTSSMLNTRLNEIVQNPNPPFVFATNFIGQMVRTKDAFTLLAATSNTGIIDGFKGLMREAERVKRFGFTATEFDRAKADYLRGLENQLKEKDKEKNEVYVDKYINHFLTGDPTPGIEFEYMFANGILPSISLDELNAFAKGLVTDNNVVITITGPKKDEVAMPTEEAIRQSIQQVKAENIEAYVDKVSNKPLVEKLAKAGKVSSTKEDKVFGTTEWTLSNGAKVVFKKTDFKEDEVLLNAFSKGGTSLADLATLPSAQMATQFVTNGGVGEFSSVDLEKMLAGKVVQVQPVIGESFEGFQGSSSPKDFETMLQLVYLYFTAPREDETAYNTLMERLKAFMANNSADPRMAFRDSTTVMMANHNPRVMPTNLEFLGKVNYKKCMDFYKSRFADASDFTFVFTGNLNPAEAKPLVEKYIASLPNIKRKEEAKDNGIRPPKGKAQNYFNKNLQTPKSSVFVAYSGNVEYNLENKVLIDVVKSILNIRYIEEIREKEGATYGVGVGASIAKFPTPSFSATMTFDTDPKLRDKMIGIIHSEIRSLITDGPSDVNLGKAREFMLKDYDQNQRENRYWSRAIREKYMYGVDINSNYKEVVNGLTPEKVKAFAKKLFEQGNVVEVVMSPAE